eukprot:Phypoly_transcript_03938.p1 GENE.Phypoly_transcript_03938~~Phypoly_transcript_03938.p1  ORF type:complete len:617 (+),score=142.69 Phypoly_transcript_03938:80-1930(+)
MFASRALENVPCPDPHCWRGFVCNYQHDVGVLQLQQLISTLIGDKDKIPNPNSANSPNPTFALPYGNTNLVSDEETKEPSPKKQRFEIPDPTLVIGNDDIIGDDVAEPSTKKMRVNSPDVISERAAPEVAGSTGPGLPSPTAVPSPPPAAIPSPPPFLPQPSEDSYIPSNKPKPSAEDLLRSSIEDVERQLKARVGETTSTAGIDRPDLAAVPRHQRPPTAPARPPPTVSTLRASIEDVGRQLSKLTRATAIPRIGGSLPSSIGDVEKQLNAPQPYRPYRIPKPDVSSPPVEIEPASIDSPKIEEIVTTKPIAKTAPSSKPIPSIQNKFLFNPPIQTSKLQVDKEALKRAKKQVLPDLDDDESEDDESSEEDDDDEDDDDESDDDESEEEEELDKNKTKTNKQPPKKLGPTTSKNVTTTKPSQTTKMPKPAAKTNQPAKENQNTTKTNQATITSQTTKTSQPTKTNQTTKTSQPTKTNQTTKTSQNTQPKITQAAKEKLALANKLNKAKADPTKSAPVEKPPAPKTPSFLEMGVALTPHQIKAAQALRVDTDKKFAGLSASEYPTIIFEVRPKVPRGVRQSYLDKFLVQFLKHFPNNKAQAIEAVCYSQIHFFPSH